MTATVATCRRCPFASTPGILNYSAVWVQDGIGATQICLLTGATPALAQRKGGATSMSKWTGVSQHEHSYTGTLCLDSRKIFYCKRFQKLPLYSCFALKSTSPFVPHKASGQGPHCARKVLRGCHSAMRKKVHAPSFLLDSNPPQKGALLIIQGRRSLGPMKQPGPSLAPA